MGTRVRFTYAEGRVAHGIVVDQYDTEPYDDTEVILDQVYVWEEHQTVRWFWFMPKWLFSRKVAILRSLGPRVYRHSSDLHPVGK
jgi:hypothetical protein